MVKVRAANGPAHVARTPLASASGMWRQDSVVLLLRRSCARRTAPCAPVLPESLRQRQPGLWLRRDGEGWEGHKVPRVARSIDRVFGSSCGLGRNTQSGQLLCAPGSTLRGCCGRHALSWRERSCCELQFLIGSKGMWGYLHLGRPALLLCLARLPTGLRLTEMRANPGACPTLVDMKPIPLLPQVYGSTTGAPEERRPQNITRQVQSWFLLP
jgi:hypothetical protein